MTLENIRRSPLTQIVVLGALTLALQIPILLIWGLVGERERTRSQAVSEIADSWGREQNVVGPFLVVPYTYSVQQTDDEGKTTSRVFSSTATFLARSLSVNGELGTETRYRGIFETQTYRGAVQLSGVYDRPELSSWIHGTEDVFWDQAEVVFEISDARAIQNAARLTWGEQDVAFEPGAGARGAERIGVHAPVTVDPEAETISFSTTFELNGSSAIRFAPMGRDTEVHLSADWPDPSFQGAWLPGEREVTDSGFTATWRIPNLGRNFPQRWQGPGDEQVGMSLFGVNLITPVDAYRQTERSLKYQILFLVLTFTTIWLFEVLSGARVHWIQYGLIGAAMCLFYLLELSLAEHLGFGFAYAIAAGAVLGLVTMYGRAVLRSAGRTATLGGVVAALYGCLYVLLRLEDYALLTGSIGLFLALATLMYLTRNVDWNAPRGEQSEAV